MSILSLIKRGRAQAKEHTAKQAEKPQEEIAKVPYRHVPTHAALDALSTAPSSYRDDDKLKIMEQHQKRKAMTAGNASINSLPRVGSSLSYVSYPSASATPVVQLPRNYSYGSMPVSWREKMTGAPEPTDYTSQPTSKGKEREQRPPVVRGTSRPLSSELSGPVLNANVRRSTGNLLEVPNKGLNPSGGGRTAGYISSSEDELEMGPTKKGHSSLQTDIRPRATRQRSASNEKSHRLHPSYRQNPVESPTSPSDRYYPPLSKSVYFKTPVRPSQPVSGTDTSITPGSTPMPSNQHGASTDMFPLPTLPLSPSHRREASVDASNSTILPIRSSKSRSSSLDTSGPPVLPPLPYQSSREPSWHDMPGRVSSSSSIYSIGMAVSAAPSTGPSTPVALAAEDYFSLGYQPTTSQDDAVESPLSVETMVHHQTLKRPDVTSTGRTSSVDTIITTFGQKTAQVQSRPQQKRRRLSKTKQSEATYANSQGSSKDSGIEMIVRTPQLNSVVTTITAEAPSRGIPKKPVTRQQVSQSTTSEADDRRRRRLSKNPLPSEQPPKRKRWSFFNSKTPLSAA